MRGVDVEAPLGGTMLIIANDDQPGVIGEVGTILGRHGVNIANFALGRSDTGAIGVVNVDEEAGAPRALDDGRRRAPKGAGHPRRPGSCGSAEAFDSCRLEHASPVALQPIVIDRDPQRPRMHARVEARPADDRLAVDVKRHRLVGFDRHARGSAGSCSRASARRCR